MGLGQHSIKFIVGPVRQTAARNGQRFKSGLSGESDDVQAEQPNIGYQQRKRGKRAKVWQVHASSTKCLIGNLEGRRQSAPASWSTEAEQATNRAESEFE